MSSPADGTGEVIDLTNDDSSPPPPPRQQQQRNNATSRGARLPRSGREIMTDGVDVVDLEEGEDEDSNSESDDDVQEIAQESRGEPPSSPEVEFVGATTRAPPVRAEDSQLWRMITSHPRANFVYSTEQAIRRSIPWARLFRRGPQDVESLFIGAPPQVSTFVDVEYPDSTTTADRGPPPETYKAPSPPPEGFTRNVKEDEVVVCPNCDEELGTGNETKQQIWVVKKCGHVRLPVATFCLQQIG